MTQLANETPHLVWIAGLNGPEPQKWFSLDYGVGDWKRNSVRAVYPLTQQESELPLDVLARLYPAPTVQ